jgi:GT2 family glycosyltransferase
MKLAPITLFVYNRLDHTIDTVMALQKNDLSKESELFIFSDGPKNKDDEKKVLAVRKYIKSIKGFKKVTIFESKKNKGLANSIISGVTKIINKYGRIIVLEDDIVTSKYFLIFLVS